MAVEVAGIVGATLLLALAAFLLWRRHQGWRWYARSLLSRPGISLEREGLWGGTRIVHKDGGVVVEAVARSRARGQPVWELRAHPVCLGQRTSLSLGREGMFSSHASSVGWQDLRVESDEFDKRYRIGGSAPGVVRAVVNHPEVRHAMVALFERRMGYVGCLLKGQDLTVIVSRDSNEPEEALGWIHAVRGLAESLNRVVDITTLPPPVNPSALPVDAVGQGSWIPRQATRDVGHE